MSSPTYRLDRLTDTWRLVAPTRARVPLPSAAQEDELPVPTTRCPFCPGHEVDAEPVVASWGEPWEVRVVGNRYPLVGAAPDASSAPARTERSDERPVSGASSAATRMDERPMLIASSTPAPERPDERPVHGAHEVVVEGRAHTGDVATFDPQLWRAVVRMFRDRVAAHEATDAAAVLVFRNRGRRAGSSQPHPHSQIVASSVVPTEMARRATLARAFFEREGRALLDAERERARADRLVNEDDAATIFCPFAPITPFETWVVPRAPTLTPFRAEGARGRARAPSGDGAMYTPFSCLSDTEADAFADALQGAVRCVLAASGRRAWNLIVHQPPCAERDAPWSRWYAAIVPRTGPGAGFELTSGTSVVSVAPERAAEALRGARIEIIRASG